VNPAILLDTYPLVKFFKGESGAERVRALLLESRRTHGRLLMTEINAGELYYIVARRMGSERAEEILASLSTVPVTLLPTTWELTLAAARLKDERSLSYADCFALAAAISEGAVLVTGDPEFKQAERLVKIEWV